MDTLLSLRVFAEVAEHKNFSAVAERLNISPAMTSKHVKHVEARVGARLLNRNSRNVSLTEAGAQYLQTIRPLLDGLSEAEAHVLSDVLTGAAAGASAEPPADAPAAPPVVVAETAPVAPAPAVADPAPIAAVKAAPFVLPMDELTAIAQSAGLQWVNSDAERIRQVQEAIAQEPKPVHVPRERKPVVVLDEGPLVLVETRKDLAQVTLPFEHKA